MAYLTRCLRLAFGFAIATAAGFGTASAAPIGPLATYQFIPATPLPIALSIRLTLAEAAVQRGAFDLAMSWPGLLTGDVGDFQALYVQVGRFGIGDHAIIDEPFNRSGAGGNFYTFGLSLTFDASGIVTSSSLQTEGYSEDVHIGGTSDAAAGTYVTDFLPCNNSLAPCAVTGFWADPSSIPEPLPSVMVLIVLLGFAWRRGAPANAD